MTLKRIDWLEENKPSNTTSMKQPYNKIVNVRWACDDYYRVCVQEEDEFADIGYGFTPLSALKNARKRLDKLSRDLDKLIEKESSKQRL
jgi:hypothetical protein